MTQSGLPLAASNNGDFTNGRMTAVGTSATYESHRAITADEG